MSDEIRVHELTQGMYEEILEGMSPENMSNARFQGELVRAAVRAGWVETSLDLELRSGVVKVFGAIIGKWKEAMTIPNA
jgi:hypothetical protein